MVGRQGARALLRHAAVDLALASSANHLELETSFDELEVLTTLDGRRPTRFGHLVALADRGKPAPGWAGEAGTAPSFTLWGRSVPIAAAGETDPPAARGHAVRDLFAVRRLHEADPRRRGHAGGCQADD